MTVPGRYSGTRVPGTPYSAVHLVLVLSTPLVMRSRYSYWALRKVENEGLPCSVDLHPSNQGPPVPSFLPVDDDAWKVRASAQPNRVSARPSGRTVRGLPANGAHLGVACKRGIEADGFKCQGACGLPSSPWQSPSRQSSRSQELYSVLYPWKLQRQGHSNVMSFTTYGVLLGREPG